MNGRADKEGLDEDEDKDKDEDKKGGERRFKKCQEADKSMKKRYECERRVCLAPIGLRALSLLFFFSCLLFFFSSFPPVLLALASFVQAAGRQGWRTEGKQTKEPLSHPPLLPGWHLPWDNRRPKRKRARSDPILVLFPGPRFNPVSARCHHCSLLLFLFLFLCQLRRTSFFYVCSTVFIHYFVPLPI